METLSFYKVAIVNKAGEEQVLSRFNGEIDFLEICDNFYNFLTNNVVHYFDNNGNKRAFSISPEIEYSKEKRSLSTYYNSAYTGQSLDIRNGVTNELVYLVSKKEFQSRKMFSLIHIPINTKCGYVVFQNKSKHGIKVVYERQLQIFMNKAGYTGYRVVMTPGLNYSYLSKMIVNGKLKKLRLINHTPSRGVQMALWDNVRLNSDFYIREFKCSCKAENYLFKKELYSLFFSKFLGEGRINFMNKYQVDEISFEITYAGMSKTFYVKDRSKVRPNISISKGLEYVFGEPTFFTLKLLSLDLINEIGNHNDFDFIEAA